MIKVQNPVLGKTIGVFLFSHPAACVVPSSTVKLVNRKRFPGQLMIDFSVSCNQKYIVSSAIGSYQSVLVSN